MDLIRFAFLPPPHPHLLLILFRDAHENYFLLPTEGKKLAFFFSCGIFLITRGRLFHTLGAWLNSAVVGKAAKKRRGTTHALASTGTFCVSSFLPEFAKTRFFDAQHFFVQRHVFFCCLCCCSMPAGLKDCLPNLTHHEKFQKVHTRCTQSAGSGTSKNLLRNPTKGK